MLTIEEIINSKNLAGLLQEHLAIIKNQNKISKPEAIMRIRSFASLDKSELLHILKDPEIRFELLRFKRFSLLK